MIHKTAIIDNKAEIDTNVEIDHIQLGSKCGNFKGTKIQSHVNITGFTKIERIIKIFFASIVMNHKI